MSENDKAIAIHQRERERERGGEGALHAHKQIQELHTYSIGHLDLREPTWNNLKKSKLLFNGSNFKINELFSEG
jgi:hypothetical protein